MIQTDANPTETLPQSIRFEGGDGTGKNFLALHTVEALRENGHHVVMTNYPQYFAFGALVRRMNRGAADSVFDTMESTYEKARHRAAMYALDRALSITPLAHTLEQFPNAINVSDRGPDSNAVTAGYIWATNPDLTEEQLQQFIGEELGTLDAEFRALTNPTNILCMEDAKKIEGVSNREMLDQLEQSDAQVKALEIYKQILPNDILHTKVEGKWQDVKGLVTKVLNKAGIALNGSEKKGDLVLIGPLESVSSIFKEIPTKLIELDSDWRKVSLDPSDPDGQRKKHLDQMEMIVSNTVGHYIGNIENLKTDLHPLTIKAVVRLMATYPKLSEIIKVTGGENYSRYIEFVLSLGAKEA